MAKMLFQANAEIQQDRPVEQLGVARRARAQVRAMSRPVHATAMFALLAGAPMLLLMPAVAQAQEAPAAPEPAPEAPSEADAITITGTRISGFSAPTPVTTLGQVELEAKAASTVADLLDDVPQLRINQNIGKSSEPIGASNADLRGLGTVRTLVLIDGRRVTPTDPAGTIDTNIVPVALIESIEIVTGGASAAYGSDAVAGVVNFKLDKNFKGLKLDASYGQTIYDDHHRPAISGAWGTSLLSDRLHLTVAADYMRNSGQTSQAARPWGDDQTALLTNPASTATNGIPRLLISDNARFTNMTAGGTITRATGLTLAQRLGFAAGTGVQFDTNGNPIPFNYGTNIGGTFMTGGDGDQVTDGGNIMPEIERVTAYGGLRFDVTDNVTLFADALYARVDSLSDLTPNPDNGSIVVRNDNAFLATSVRDAMTAAGLTSFNMGRMNYEDGISLFDSFTEVRRYTFGAEGRFGDNWTWDISAQIGRNKYEQISYNNRIADRWTLGLDSVINPATNQPICRALLNNPNPTAAQDPYGDIRSCVPINPFGAGSVTPAALDYYRGTSFTRTRQEQDVFAANISGSPFSTWAGAVRMAFGAEHRREKTVLEADADSAARRWRSVNSQPFSGEYNVKEGYLEVVVPLVNGAAFADNLDINGAIRYTDYELSGGVTTWKLGMNYSPIPDVRFRATLSRDIRAPNVWELFSRGNQVINAIIDPRTNTSRLTPNITSGNPALEPEKADTFTGGVVFQPGFLPGFRAAIDYYRININGAITTVAPQAIVNLCDQGQTQFCASVVRDPTSDIITQVNVVPFNAASLKTSGVDVEVQYRFNLGGGSLTLRGLANYVAELSIDGNDYVGLAGVSPPPQGVPEWRVNLDANYTLDDFRFGISYRFIDGGKVDTRYNLTRLDIADNTIAGRSYVDLSTSYKLTSAVEVYGRVENLFNVHPPVTPNGITQPTIANSQFFDRRGTFFVVGTRFRL